MGIIKQTATLLLLLTYPLVSNAQTKDLKVEPAFWWENMKYNHLELMLYGNQLALLQPEIIGGHVKLLGVKTTENPNYLFVNVDIGKEAQKGFNIILKNAKGKKKHNYWFELKKRKEGSQARQGFNTSDVIYLLMPDRFSNGNPNNDSHPEMLEKPNRNISLGRHGGDISGITENIGYLSSLGYTALWLNPVLENNMPKESYHGYAITDLYKVDPRFGNNTDYVHLVEECHNHSMKVIKDMVFNHLGTNHYLIKDMPMKNWVNEWDEFTRSNYRGMTISSPNSAAADRKYMNKGWFDYTMADLNQKNPHVFKYLVQNSIWWIEFANLDGIRMDTYPYPDKDAMAEWAKIIKSEYPNFSIVAESWLHLPMHTAYWQEGAFTFDDYNSNVKSVTDFPLHYAVNAAFNENDGWKEGFNRIYYTLSQDGVYSNPDNLVIFTDNHDVERFSTVMGNDINKFKNALVFYLTSRGIPQVYYGTEIMMGSTPYQDHGSWRRDYPGGWEGDSVNAFTGMGLSPKQLEAQKFTKQLLNWRKTATPIHNGKLIQFLPQENCYVYCRYTTDQAILVILNKNPKETELDLSRFAECTKGYSWAHEIISGNKIEQLESIILKANTPIILELKN